jgi:glutamate synthase (NADPH/NADH) large chain
MQGNNPKAAGLYRPEFEHDNCGIGLVVQINGSKSHDIVEGGLQVLENLNHRGAESADNETGDGAGITVQIPHEFILLQGIAVPERGKYGTGLMFLPKDKQESEICEKIFADIVKNEGLRLLAVRDVPVNSAILGAISRSSEPVVKQVFVCGLCEQGELERKLYIIRKKTEKAIVASAVKNKRAFYIVSLSTKSMTYKGMLTSLQLRTYFPDLTNDNFTSAIALVHSRFSTNTFPTWDLAQPFRLLGHNGEINTIKGNRFWMQARESVLNSDLLGDLKEIYPIIEADKSDSASFDNVLEFLVQAGRSLPHALAMLIPESWNKKNPIPEDLRAFYEYHSTFMEPWDGPASLVFTDGRYAGGMLDRNGLRPSRYLITKDGLLIMGSETGVQSIAPENIQEKGRLRPGKMMLVDTQLGKVIHDSELKAQLAREQPYLEWLAHNRVDMEDLSSGREISNSVSALPTIMRAFGYSKEDVEMIMAPMAVEGKEPTSSMGNDTPVALLSQKPQRLYNYFRQLFAQVTNPPIDPIREELVMSLTGYIGALQKNPLDASPDHCKTIKLTTPVITNTQFDIIKNLRYKGFSSVVIPILFPVADKAEGLRKAIEEICIKAEEAVDSGKNFIILSDRGVSEAMAPIPSLLAISAVHHHLIDKRKRMQIDLVMETAEPREVMHFALLFGYGASAINPYLAFGVLDDLVKQKAIQIDYQKAQDNYIKSVNKGILKVLSKMGISTLRSYRAAQIFEAVGIKEQVIDRYFAGTVSRIGGIGLEELAEEALIPHREAYLENRNLDLLPNPGFYHFRNGGEQHAWDPETIATLQWATRTGDYRKFKDYVKLVNDRAEHVFLRDFMRYKSNPIDISLVEPASEITKRFVTGAMSYGSISREAHEALAIAMNRLGGKSNTGEGGEDPERFIPRADGTNARSAIKQVASGRFGVTTEYLVNADELQIKIAQGAKPGEGGQLPGYKVDKIIAKTRHSIPGISLISPPPHHDIYSIEDLAQLIFDLKNVNPSARVSVKLVAETGVGTIAAGVAKAKADMILISGCEGGTGASPSSSIKHAGLPVELGISETQQVLVMNNLRDKVVLQTDGQLKTGLDVILMGMLGAEEFGFSTSSLIVLGCIMMRKCHLNTCPVGVATQDERLRKHFVGKADYLVNFFNFIAEDIREHLAALGFKKFDDIVGRTDLLTFKPQPDHWKAKNLSLEQILYVPEEVKVNRICHVKEQNHKLEEVLDQELIKVAQPAILEKKKVFFEKEIKNTDRTAGAMLSGVVAKKYGNAGLPEDTINFTFKGSAGQSFGAFLSRGLSFKLEGDANDYMGKGLSGGKIVVVPPKGITYQPEENVIIGNTVLYGATSGEVYINGIAGERFCVRNSGAIAVVEGAGDHCCEYMTGGRTVVLGRTGRNFAAGMSGGIAYVLNVDGNFDYFCNMGMVELTLLEDMQDQKELKDLITRHYQYTASPLAGKILENWANYVIEFIKVTPIEYKKVLEEERIEAIKKKIAMVEFDY